VTSNEKSLNFSPSASFEDGAGHGSASAGILGLLASNQIDFMDFQINFPPFDYCTRRHFACLFILRGQLLDGERIAPEILLLTYTSVSYFHQNTHHHALHIEGKRTN